MVIEFVQGQSLARAKHTGDDQATVVAEDGHSGRRVKIVAVLKRQVSVDRGKAQEGVVRASREVHKSTVRAVHRNPATVGDPRVGVDGGVDGTDVAPGVGEVAPQEVVAAGLQINAGGEIVKGAVHLDVAARFHPRYRTEAISEVVHRHGLAARAIEKQTPVVGERRHGGRIVVVTATSPTTQLEQPVVGGEIPQRAGAHNREFTAGVYKKESAIGVG